MIKLGYKTYYCEECEHKHRISSKKGKEHYKYRTSMVEKTKVKSHRRGNTIVRSHNRIVKINMDKDKFDSLTENERYKLFGEVGEEWWEAESMSQRPKQYDWNWFKSNYGNLIKG